MTVMFVSVLQQKTTFYLSKRWGSLRGALMYRRTKFVCINIIHDLIVQWKTKSTLQYYKECILCVRQCMFYKQQQMQTFTEL